MAKSKSTTPTKSDTEKAVQPEETKTPAAPDSETAGTKPAATPDAVAAGDPDTALPDEQATSKEVIDTYEKVYRIPAVEPGSTKLPAGFPVETYGAAAVREAIQHGWRPKTVGELAAKSSVKSVEGDPGSIDILFTVEVIPASEAGAQPPVGQTVEEASNEDDTTEGDK